MKKEATKKNLLWLWLLIGAAALLLIGGVLALVFGIGSSGEAAVSQRPDLYWNVDVDFYTANSDSGLSTREPAEDGLYHIRFSHNGQPVEYTAAGKQLVNFIDSLDVMSLTVDSDGSIVDVIEPKNMCTVIGQRIYTQQVLEGKLIANSSLAMNGMKYEVLLGELTQVYDVSPEAETVGQLITLSDISPMDTVGVYANAEGAVTHIYLVEHPERTDIYWRAEQFYDSSLKQTTRLPDKDGIYHMDFYCNGELVTLKTRDKNIVNHVDSRDRYACAKGFLFDQEGFVIGELDPALGTRTVMGCERYDVTEISGSFVNTAKYWNNDGSVYSFNIADDCVIYDVSTAAEAEGRRGKQVDGLQLGDRITVWTNTEGQAVIIYVACRVVDTDIYYIPTLKYDSTTKQTTRTPNWEGYYEVELLKAGQTENRTYRIKDKALMDYLDSQSAKTIGITLEGDVIQCVYNSECLFGYTPLTRGGTVPSVSGSIFTRMTYGKPEAVRTSILDPNCKIYNVSEVGSYGEETTLQPFDRIYAHKKPTGEAICIFVTQRRVGLDHLYWNLSRQYDAATKSTTRVPDAEGWYIFDMVHAGKQVQLKTRSKTVASKIDAQSTLAIGLNVSGDVITKAFTALNTSGGSVTMSGYRVKQIRQDGVVTVYTGSGDTYRERMFRMKSDCRIYNVSDAYYDYKGEVITGLKTGDMVLVVTDIYAEAEVVFVRYREAENMYWRTDRCYDTVSQKTTRTPDAEGWYHYDLAVNGKLKSFKTKDETLATKLDAVTGAFGLVVDGDVIRSYVPTNWVRNVGFVGVTNWEVTAVSGNRITVAYNIPGSGSTGKTQTITLASGARIYDVSPTAQQFGAATKLKVGDQIRTYQNESNTAHLYVYVQHRANRAEGIDGYCAHCDRVVHWNPYAGGSITRASGHYYLSGDCTTNEQLGIGLEDSDYEIVLDLNGKTLTRLAGGRFALVRFGDTLTVMDSVGGGQILCQGAEGWNGGVMYVDGGKLNLMGGTLGITDKTVAHKWGGVLYLSGSTFQMSGGTIQGGAAQRGGSIYNTGASTIVMSGGTITGGTTVKEAGGNIYLMSDTTMKMSGGAVCDGYAETRSGNIHVDSAVLEITGGTVRGGSSKLSDDGICVNSSKSSITLENVTCEDHILVRYMGQMTLGGKVSIGLLEIPVGKQFTLGQLEADSKVTVKSSGPFTYPSDNAQAYAGYFVSGAEGLEVSVVDNMLSLESEKVYCAHCDKKVNWAQWSADTTIEGTTEEGEATHFLLTDDFSAHTAQRTVKGNVVLDLCGHDYTTEGIRNFLVSGSFTVMDSVGGGVMSADGAGSDGSVAYVNVGGTFTLHSGTLRQTGTVNNGGVLAVNKGNVNILGGQVLGGEITGSGSAIWNKTYGSVNIAGGVIDGSVSVNGSVDTKATLTVSGGRIAAIVPNAYVQTTVSGAPKIQALDLSEGKKITLGEMTGEASVTVTAEGVFTEENEKAGQYATYFHSADSQPIVAVGNVLRVGQEAAPEPEIIICPHCNKEVEWTLWPCQTKPASGHYYIEQDFTGQTGQLTISNDVVLDLRGNDYTTEGIRNFLVTGTFSIVDTAGGGTMTADGASSDGSIAYLNGAAARLNVYGGTLKLGENAKVNNGGLIAANRGTVAICGAELIGGQVSGEGSAIWNKRFACVSVENASITGSVYITGDSESNATLSLNDATVNGKLKVADLVDVTVAGKTLLSDLDLTGGRRITLGELAADAAITVTADDGAFTMQSDKAADYLSCFRPANAEKLIFDYEKALYMGDERLFKNDAVQEAAVKMTADGVFAETNIGADGYITATCPYCGQEAKWEKLQSVSERVRITGTHHYYLASDLSNTYYYYFGDGTTTDADAQICLHLNGHTITNTVGASSDDGRAIYLETDGRLNIMGAGTVTGACKRDTYGAIDIRGELNLCGGALKATGSNPVLRIRHSGAVVNVFRAATVGEQTQTSVGVSLNNGRLNICGGKLYGDTQVASGTAISVAGAPFIQKLTLPADAALVLGDLAKTADITVEAADGPFTEKSDKAADYAACFKASAEGKTVTEEDGKLVIAAASTLQLLKAFFRF